MTSPVSIVVGAPLLASDFDAYENATAAWATYVPAWSSTGTQPALVNGTLTGRYRQVGKTVDAFIRLVPGSSTTFGTGVYFLSLPSTAAYFHPGAAFLNDLGTGDYEAMCRVWDSDPSRIFILRSTALVAATSPFTWASGDSLIAQVTYQAV